MMNSITYRPCAACKHTHSACRPDCILRPYFPADDQSIDFQNVLRLFTTSKLKKLLQDTSDKDRKDLVESIKFEAAAHARFPVHGTLMYIIQLEHQIKLLTDELLCIQNQIVSARNAAAFFRDDGGGDSFDDSQMRPLQRTLPASNDINENANDNVDNNQNTIDFFADSRLLSEDKFQSTLDLNEDDEDPLL